MDSSTTSNTIKIKKIYSFHYTLLECLLVFIISAGFYRSLYGELPWHDAGRFAAQINSGKYVWDIAHIFLQPATLLWHKYLGFGAPAELSQKEINTVATAAGLAVFYYLLVRIGLPLWKRLAATAFIFASNSFITLAVTGNMKLVAFPFVTASFCVLALWEREHASGRAGSNRDLAIAAVLLALAGAFLASCLATPPFAMAAIFLASIRTGDGWRMAFARSFGFGALCGLVFLICVVSGYLVFIGGPADLLGATAASLVYNVQAANAFSYSATVTDVLGRIGLATVNNIVAAPDFGAIIRAWMHGQIPSLRPYAGTLVPEIPPLLVTLALLAAIYLRSFTAAIRGVPCLVPIAFLLGAQAWAIYNDVNDPEHLFQLTVPTVFLAITLFSGLVDYAILAVWGALTITVNLTTVALPEQRYPFVRYVQQLRSLYSPRDLLIEFAGYPGGPDSAVMNLPGVPRLKLDNLYYESKDQCVYFTRIARAVDHTLTAGGKVVVFGVLDPYNWNNPWPGLLALGMPKQKLFDFFYDHYRIRALGKIAEIKAWQIVAPRQPVRPECKAD
jgi:hypothetical protein